MAVHITIYPEDRTAAALRQFMAAHDCSATTAVELLLARHAEQSRAAVNSMPAEQTPHVELGLA